MFSLAPDKAQKGPSRSRTWNNRTTERPESDEDERGAYKVLQNIIDLPFGGESSANLVVKLGGSAVKIAIPGPLAERVLALCYSYMARGRLSKTHGASYGVY